MIRTLPAIPSHPRGQGSFLRLAGVSNGRTADPVCSARTANGRAAFLRVAVLTAILSFLFSACGTQPDAVSIPTRTSSPTRPSPTYSQTLIQTATVSNTATPTQEPAAERIPIVEYHHSTFRFSDDVLMTTEWFHSQMDWLSENGYRTINAEQLAAFLDGEDIPAKSVVLTFDIGTAQRSDYLENIIPALKQHGFHALFFVVISALTDDCGKENKVCWKDLQDWAAEGLISVESHTVYHPDFTAVSTEEQRWEAQVSRQTIADKIGREPIGFAYPYDSFTEGATRVVESVGYRFALAGNTRNDRSVHRSDPDRYFLPRVYPYSNPQIYPVLNAAYGKTFGEMIAEASGTSPALSPTPPNATAATPTPSAEAESYFTACSKINQITDESQRLYSLDQLAIVPDLSPAAQAQLSSPILFKPSCNVAQGNVPRGIVLHITRGPLTGTLHEFQRPQNTSAHYVIDRDGQIYQLVPEGLGAYHASCGGNRSVCLPSCPLCEGPEESFLEPYLQSVGIELVNDGQLPHPETYTGLIYEDYLMAFGYRFWEDFPEVQLQALVILVNDIRARHGIPLELVVGHYRINYKTDPGPALNISWYRVGNPPRAPIFSE